MMKSDVFRSLRSSNLSLSFSISPLVKWALTILVLGAGIVLVLFLYTQEQSRNHALQSQVDRAAFTLVQNNLAQRDLEGQVATANLELAELRTRIPSSSETMTLEEALYGAASVAGVEILSVSVGRSGGQQAGGYQPVSVSLWISGQQLDQMRFVGVLGHWLPSADITSASLAGESVTLNMVVYVQ